METTPDEELTVDLKQLHETQRTITGIHEVYGEIYQQIGFDRLWGQSSRFFARKEILKHITLARIAQPDSKRAGVAALERDFGIKIPLTSVYRMMDNLDDKAIDFIQGVALSAAQQMLGESLDVLFYDCTTLYFESFVSDICQDTCPFLYAASSLISVFSTPSFSGFSHTSPTGSRFRVPRLHRSGFRCFAAW